MPIRPVSRLLVLCAAVTLTAAAQVKVGVINTQKALLDTGEMKKAQADMEAKFKPRQDQMEKLQKDIQGIQQQLQTLAGKLNAQGEAELQNQGARKQKELQRIGEDLQADVDRERSDILQRAGNRMQEVVKKLAESMGLDLVVDVSNTVFFKPALEVTAQATAAYDKAHPVK